MGILYEKAMEELERTSILDQLHSIGVNTYESQSIYELDYKTLVYVLSLSRIQNEN